MTAAESRSPINRKYTVTVSSQESVVNNAACENAVDGNEGKASGEPPSPSPMHMDLSGDRRSPESPPNFSIDSNFILPKCPMPPHEEFAPVEVFVSNAVEEQHLQKDDTLPLKNYRGILEALRFKCDVPLLRNVMIALRTAGDGATLHLLTVSSTKHARLIHQIIRFNPFQVNSMNAEANGISNASDRSQSEAAIDYALVDAHLHLVVALVSANSVFLVPALTSLWKSLTFQIAIAPVERAFRIHAALANIIRLCPKATRELPAIISSHCPFRKRPGPEILWYHSQCLRVLKYHPSLQGQILELLIDKCLEMDVEIKINDKGETLIDEEHSEGEVLQFDVDISDADKQQSVPSFLNNDDAVEVDEMAEKLDLLMSLLLQYIQSSVEESVSSALVLYEMITRAFESSILITHKSKFVQFLVLHICGMESNLLQSLPIEIAAQQKPIPLYRTFASRLIDIILDPYRSTLTRQCGACYLASFISRASYVCPETACESVCVLLRWAEAYIISMNTKPCYSADARDQCNLHSLFYTVCQSAFYIMCFRGLETIRCYRSALTPDGLLSEDMEHIDIGPERWTLICSNALQPLRFCLESVRSEFLSVARLFGLIYPEKLNELALDDCQMASGLKRRKPVARINTAATLEEQRLRGGVGGLGRGTNPLDSFFPFDPYLLRQSNEFIEPFYVHWKGSVEPEEDNESFVSIFCPPTDIEIEESEEETVSEDGEEQDQEVEQLDDQNVGLDLNGTSANSVSISTSSKSPRIKSKLSPDTAPKKEALQEAWANTLKRSRAPSIENGSW